MLGQERRFIDSFRNERTNVLPRCIELVARMLVEQPHLVYVSDHGTRLWYRRHQLAQLLEAEGLIANMAAFERSLKHAGLTVVVRVNVATVGSKCWRKRSKRVAVNGAAPH
jgi:hypothetical protein